MVGLPFGEVIFISRHIRVLEIRSYLNLSPLKDVRDPNTPPSRPADVFSYSWLLLCRIDERLDQTAKT
ncbi:MAG TPA: hypothetical protein VGJ20_13960 [Xanthobacteraceae bacterium]